MDINQQFHYHSISPEQAANKINTNIESGLSSEEVKKRRNQFGENKLPEKGKKTALMIFLKQFKDLLILILFIAAAISWYVGEMTDVYVIVGVILFNAIMGFIQEYKAEKAIESIKKMVKHTTMVIRGGEKQTVQAVEIVPGDLIEIEEGQTIPADARLIKVKNLQVIEASLTGESVPSDKNIEQVDQDAPVADRKSMVFKGTQVARGAGTAIVTGTAEHTEIGKIASSLSEMEKTSSAFKGKTNKLAKIMAAFAIATSAIVFLIGYFFRDYPFEEILLVTIATLVSSIPEGLPVVISIVLAIGAKRMAKSNAIIREFSATEMLGSVTTILTDKTGTITQSILTVKKMFINKDLEVDVSGKGYQLEGVITKDDEELELGQDSRFDKMALIAAYCNNSQIQKIEEEEEEEEEFEEDEEHQNKKNDDLNRKKDKRSPNKEDQSENTDADENIKQDKKYREDRKVVEDENYQEIQKTEEYHDERIEDGKHIIEDHKEEIHKKILKEDESERTGIEKQQIEAGNIETEDKEAKEEKRKKEGENKPRPAKNTKEETPDTRNKKQEKDGVQETEKPKQIDDNKNSEEDNDGDDIEVTGDPTEAALLVLGKKARVKEKEPFNQLQVLDDLPFNSEVKFRATLVKYPDGKKEIFVVGAPEKMLELSNKIITSEGAVDLTDDYKGKVRDITDNYTEKAMRVLALAYKETDIDSLEQTDVSDLVWTGITGIIDPPREGVKEAIKAAKDAGIRVVMVTGDHKKTARSIAQNIGIIDNEGQAMTSKELKSDEENFAKNVENINVFARVDPDAKLRIAKHLREKGELVGMTGDGVNDAPALKRADVGIAMGQRGTDVAKDSSEIVLSDDNFSTIVKAIEEGRIVFNNIRNTSFFLLTTNFASVMTIIICIAIGFPLPLLATQILFVNMVTDGIMDVALATEPGHGDIMKKKPYGRHENILNKEILPNMILMVVIMVGLTIYVFQYYLPEGEEMARTGAFVTIAMTQLFNAFNLRTPDKSVFKIGIFSNKWIILAFVVSIAVQLAAVKLSFMQEAFKFEEMPWTHFAIITVVSSVVLWVGELYKYLKHKKEA